MTSRPADVAEYVAGVVGDVLPVDLTEDALTLEFTRRHRDDLRYVAEWGKWLRWDGTRWAQERTLAVYDLARTLVRDIGINIEKPPVRAKIEGASTVAAIVSLARADRAHARVTEDFDADGTLYNTPAGTVDLPAGEMREHRREDNITKVSPVSPGDGDAPLWRSCIETWTQGDVGLAAFLQRLAGYFLTGSVREEKLPIVYGGGGNGKSKFVETLRAVMGSDYVTNVVMETLTVTNGDQHPTDVADLRAKRLAIANETEEGRRLAEAKVKMLTGGDRLRARYMRRDFFEFEPTHKLLIVGNHKPTLRNTDEAMRRRLLLIPFDAVIPAEKRDPDLAKKLEAEYPQILRWMIDGCLMWQRSGLCPPARVLAATNTYFETSDSIGRWIEERCIVAKTASIGKAELYSDWKTWAETNGEFPGSQRRLNETLEARYDLDETFLGPSAARKRSWVGIGLRQ